MNKAPGKKLYKGPEIVALLLFILLSAYVYVGFYSPDPYALRHVRTLYVVLILWGARFLIPLCVIGVLLLYRKVKKGLISRAHIGLVFGGVVLGLFLIYPFVNIFYEKSHRRAEGLRDYHPYFQVNPPLPSASFKSQGPDLWTVMCLGGSTTQFKDSKGRDWPSRVEDILRDRYRGQRVEVLNMGMMWYTSLHSLMNYAVNLRPFKPRVIIVMHAINDLLQNADFSYFSHGPFREDYGHFFGPVNNLFNRPGLLRSVWDTIGYFWYYKPRQVIEQTDFPGLIPFRRNINGIIDLAEKDGATVVLMTQPTLLKDNVPAEEKAVLTMVNDEAIGTEKCWSVATAWRGMRAYNDAVRDIARERNVYLIDLERQIPKTLEYFSDEVHYKDKTFDIIGSTIAGELIRRDVLAATPTEKPSRKAP
jgi:hypothetical protein